MDQPDIRKDSSCAMAAEGTHVAAASIKDDCRATEPCAAQDTTFQAKAPFSYDAVAEDRGRAEKLRAEDGWASCRGVAVPQRAPKEVVEGIWLGGGRALPGIVRVVLPLLFPARADGGHRKDWYVSTHGPGQ